MAVTSTRREEITFDGDVVGAEILEAADNLVSPGSIEIKTLASGFTSISVPTGGSTVTACTIVPPAGNSTSITLKGVTGDTGIRIHNTDPTTIAIHSSVTAIGITTGAIITGVRFFWS
jgi:hypothetical protein